MKKKLGFILLIILEILLFFIELKFLGNNFSIDRFLILSFVIMFLCLHLILDIKKMYNFIFKKRYLIGLILLIIITIRGYHGSSIGAWNNIIQPNHNVDDGGVLLGILRLIRGDEYIVSTPNIISQTYNNFNKISNIVMGKSSLVTLFPMLPSYDLSVLCNLFNFPYLIMPFENAFALSWFGKLFLIFFVNFELLLLVTKKNKLYSLLGTILITFSAASAWWSNMAILAWGPLAIVVLDLFLKSDKVYKRIFYMFIFSLVGINYIMLMYPAWQVPFGYVYLSLVIWILSENKDKLNKKQIIYLILSLILMGVVVYLVFSKTYEIFLLTTSTVYPGERFINGGYGYQRLFNYMVNIFFPCIPFFNPCEFSDFIGMYPIPIIISIFTIIKQYKEKLNKKDLLLILLTITSIFLSIWNFITLPEIFVKLSLLSFSIPERSIIVIGYICIILLVRLMSLYENEITDKKNIVFSLLSSILFVSLGLYFINITFKDFLNLYMNIIIIIVFLPILFLILINNKKYNKFLAITLIIISLFVGGTINPISKGTAVLTDKPVAKEITKIIKEDKDSKWITIDSNYAISNYLIANGASTINSTNFYPNLDLWYSIDKNKEYEDIYNRYAHILISLTNKETSFELVATDSFKINLNIKDINKLDVDYVVTEKEIEKEFIYKFNLLYNEDGIFIYELIKE